MMKSPPRRVFLDAPWCLLLFLGACESPSGDVPLVLTCPSHGDEAGFLNLDFIPPRYTMAAGANESPPLQWNDGPTATAQWALVAEDRDATQNERTRWVLYHIPAYLRQLPAAIPNGNADLGREYFGIRQGRNARDSTEIGYRGPNPPSDSGVHRYRFTLYALDALIDLPAGASREDLETAIQGHVLARTTLDGKFGEAPEDLPRTAAKFAPSSANSQADSARRGPGPPEPDAE
ncbi:MAG: YbhB/YbcL family Raf kinase inhibitor-like protein [Planctomycetales bacterium]|nr:YbhB/YbcL family Raf kinase inhibitor-like protein [Planctomycetales bacterium]